MIILTIKQLKRRVVQGLVEPELAYMPLGKKEEKKGTLIVNLLTYSTYDIDNAKFISDLTMESYGAIVIVNSKNEIVYNTKMQKDQSVFVINMLPYGKYKITQAQPTLEQLFSSTA